jgi:hypothetical protein
MYSDADKNSARETPLLHSFAKMSAGELKTTMVVAPREHGTRMLRGEMILKVMDWILNPVRVVQVSTETAPAPAAPVSAPVVEDADEEGGSGQGGL